MTRDLIETLMVGILATSDNYEDAQAQMISMFPIRKIIELSAEGIDPLLIWDQLLEKQIKVEGK